MEEIKKEQLIKLKEEIKKGFVRLSVIIDEKGAFEFYDFENMFRSVRKFNDYNKALNFVDKYIYISNKIEQMEEELEKNIKQLKNNL